MLHHEFQMIGRSAGRSVVAHAAYIACRKLDDDRQGMVHDYSDKAGLGHQEIMAPPGAPSWVFDPAKLWNAVDAAELRKDAQTGRRLVAALPIELSEAGQVALMRRYVEEAFVSRGMIAEVVIHRDDPGNPHAHVLLTTRILTADGFGKKNRDWNKRALVDEWRQCFARHATQELKREGHVRTEDLRSYKRQGLLVRPQPDIGIPKALADEIRSAAPDRRRQVIRKAGYGRTQESIERAVEEQGEALRANGDLFLGRPDQAARAISKERATFTEKQLRSFLKARMDAERVPVALETVLKSPAVLLAGRDSEGQKRFVARSFAQLEHQIMDHAEGLAGSNRHRVPARTQAVVAKISTMSAEQEAAFRHITGDRDLAVVQGYAGAGKSFLLGEARKAWDRNGQNVKGVTLAAKAAASLSRESGIDSRTIDSALMSQGFFQAGMVLVVDEAGMVGTEHMEKLLARSREVRAKVVLVGDREQLAAVAGGRPMDIAAEVAGEIRLAEVRRQKVAWQRVATMAFGDGRTRDALAAYDENGHFHRHGDNAKAIEDIISRWAGRSFGAEEGSVPTQLMLAFRNSEVEALNRMARDLMTENGKLGASASFSTVHGTRDFAVGDRILFGKNDRELGVKNGSLGTVIGVEGGLKVRLDSGEDVQVDTGRYREFGWGYAGTIHKSQGDTVDFVEVLASSGFDRHLAYVAMSRHRHGVEVHYSGEEFQSKGDLFDVLSKRDTRLNVRDLAVEPAVQEEIYRRLAVLSDSELSAEIVDAEDRLNGRGPPPETSAEHSKRVAELEGRVAALGGLRDHALEEARAAAAKGAASGEVLAEAREAELRAVRYFDRREPLLRELEALRSESRAFEAELVAHQGEIREGRVVEAELAIGRSIETERRVAVLQRHLSELELVYGAEAAKWISLDRSEPDFAVAARTGGGAEADSYRDFRVLERQVNDLRWELGGLRGLNSDWRIETDREVPSSVEVARALYDPAAERFGAAEAAWAGVFASSAGGPEIEAARSGRGALANTYSELVQASRERALSERHLRIVEVERALAVAEDRFLEASQAWATYRELDPKEARWAFMGEGHAAEVYQAERAAMAELRRLSNLHDGLVGRGRLHGPERAPVSVAVAEQQAQAAIEAWKVVRGGEAGVALRRQPAGARENLYQQAREALGALTRARIEEARVRSFERLASAEVTFHRAAAASDPDALYRATKAWSKAVAGVERYAAAEPPAVYPVPIASDERYELAKTRLVDAAEAWAEVRTREPELVEARIDGRLVCPEYLAFRAAGAEVSVHEEARAIDRVEVRLERAESLHRNAVEAFRDAKVYAGEEATRFAYLGQGELGRLQKTVRTAQKNRQKLEQEFAGLLGGDAPKVPAADIGLGLGKLEAKEQELVARWHAFRQFHANEVREARRGEGRGAGLYAEYRAASAAAHEARKSAYEDRVFRDIHRLEGQAFVAEGRWETFRALSPAQVGAAWRGTGAGAELLEAKRVAERQLFVAEQTVDRSLGRSFDDVRARPLDDKAVARWHEVRLANPEVAAQAREGAGPQAATYSAYREARVAAGLHREQLKVRRVDGLLARADSLETKRCDALGELLLAKVGVAKRAAEDRSGQKAVVATTPEGREAALYAAVKAFPEEVPKAAEAFLDHSGLAYGMKRSGADLDEAAEKWQAFSRANTPEVVAAARQGEGVGKDLYAEVVGAAHEVAFGKRLSPEVREAVLVELREREAALVPKLASVEAGILDKKTTPEELRLCAAGVAQDYLDLAERQLEAGVDQAEMAFDAQRRVAVVLENVETESVERNLVRAEEQLDLVLDARGDSADIYREERMEAMANALGRFDRLHGVQSELEPEVGAGNVQVWRAFKETAAVADIEAARSGEGAGAEYFDAMRSELRMTHKAAYEAGQQGLGLQQVDELDRGELGRVARAFGEAERELRKVESQLEKAGAIRASGRPQREVGELGGLRDAASAWERLKETQPRALILDARKGLGEGADVYAALQVDRSTWRRAIRRLRVEWRAREEARREYSRDVVRNKAGETTRQPKRKQRVRTIEP